MVGNFSGIVVVSSVQCLGFICLERLGWQSCIVTVDSNLASIEIAFAGIAWAPSPMLALSPYAIASGLRLRLLALSCVRYRGHWLGDKVRLNTELL
jgi:hypothetical protein